MAPPSNFSIYNIDDKLNAQYVVVPGTASTGALSTSLFLVEGISEALDEDGIEGVRINGMYEGKYQGIFVDTEAPAFDANAVVRDPKPNETGDEVYGDPNLLNLKPGDIIMISQDSLGKINNIFKVYTLEQDSEWIFGRNSDRRYISYQKVIKPNREYLLGGSELAEWMFSSEGSGNEFRLMDVCLWRSFPAIVDHVRGLEKMGNNVIVNCGVPYDGTNPISPKIITYRGSRSYVYDEVTETVRKATDADFGESEYNTAVIYNRYGILEDLVIIKHKEPVTDAYWYGYTD